MVYNGEKSLMNFSVLKKMRILSSAKIIHVYAMLYILDDDLCFIYMRFSFVHVST